MKLFIENKVYVHLFVSVTGCFKIHSFVNLILKWCDHNMHQAFKSGIWGRIKSLFTISFTGKPSKINLYPNIK